HVRGARRRALLRLLRGDADPDVSGHRRLGWAQPRLRGGEVLPVYAARVAPDADRLSLPLPEIGRQLFGPRLPQAAAALEHADPAIHRFPYGLRGEGADVARAHLAPGRSRRGADRGL